MNAHIQRETRTYVIGRGGDIRVDDSTASGRHAELVVLGDSLYLTDLGSTNGTYLWREGRWERFQEGYVTADMTLAFGRCTRTVAALLAQVGLSPVKEGAAG